MTNLFDSVAEGYARSRPALHAAIFERARTRLGITAPVDVALDVGCGAGLSTRPLADWARLCAGIEPNVSMLRYAVRDLPGARFVAGQAERLPFPNGSVHLITAAGSLNFLDTARFFEEAARVLVPQGVVIVYDFSPGRTFADGPELDGWVAGFLDRYPPGPAFGRPLDPDLLLPFAAAFHPTAGERFAIPLDLEAAFYARYESLDPVAALSEEDRLIGLVGELEADVGNGGFARYLDNKGVGRARAALAALTAIGARRTARWLSSALAAGKGSTALKTLDEQFCLEPEDLASLVMRHLERRMKA